MRRRRRRRRMVVVMMVRIRGVGLVHHLGWVGITGILMMLHRSIILMLLLRIVQRWVVRHLGMVMLLMMMHLRHAEASRTPPGIHEFHDGIGE